MQEQPQWIPYQELDFDCPNFNVFSIDTRDFHAGYRLEKEEHADIDTLKKYPDFFHTKEEVIKLLDRFFIESGGEGEWRMLSLSDSDNWQLKYIRIWRSSLGFLVCNSENRALKKSFLEQKVNQEYLGKY